MGARPKQNAEIIKELERIKLIKETINVATLKGDYEGVMKAKKELDKYTRMFERVKEQSPLNAYVLWNYYVNGYDINYIAKCFNMDVNNARQRKKYAIRYIYEKDLINEYIYNDLPKKKVELINDLGKKKEGGQ